MQAESLDALATKNDLVVLRAELRAEMAALGAELRTEIAKQGGELRAEIGSVVRQMYVALLGQTVVLLGFFYFFLVQLRA